MKISRIIVKLRILIIIISFFLLIPGYYEWQKIPIIRDILEFLPTSLPSVKGQKILENIFNSSSNAYLYFSNAENKNYIVNILNQIKKIKGVVNILSPESLNMLTIPKDFLPAAIREQFYPSKGLAVSITLDSNPNNPQTFKIVEKINNIIKGHDDILFVGYSVINAEMRKIYGTNAIDIYLILSLVVLYIILTLSTGSIIIPFLFLLSIGISYIINMGTNFIFKNGVSFLTQSLSAALQLGVTIDYSIFLLHRYEEEYSKLKNKFRAMEIAIHKTATSITTSSFTTIFGFLAVTFMTLGLGKDLGYVLAKGIFLSFVFTLTLLPSLILVLDNIIRKSRFLTHKAKFIETFSNLFTNKIFRFVVFILFISLSIFSIYGYKNTPITYDLTVSYPENLKSLKQFNKFLEITKSADILSLIIDLSNEKGFKYFKSTDDLSYIDRAKLQKLINDIIKLDGIPNKYSVLSINSFGSIIEPITFLPEDILKGFIKDKYMLINIKTSYKAGTQKSLILNNKILQITKKYYKNAYLAGQSSLISDFIKIATIDFDKVNLISIIFIFIILLIYSLSLTIPIILTIVIEIAIAVNFTIPFILKTPTSFIAQIILGAIQLGATVDYAVLFVNRFNEELFLNNFNRKLAIKNTISSTFNSILTASLCLFSATFGYAIFNDIPVVRTIAGMIGRGALISFIIVIFFFPSVVYYLSYFFKLSFKRKLFLSNLFTKNKK